MEASFDKAASNYDETFTNSEIGKIQRHLVYTELSKHLNSIQNILEINCGTGEDAIWLAKQNFNVTATDISPKMIEIAKSKANLNFKTADINSITKTFEGETFDLIFSNFGGLNCLSKSEFENFFANISSILSEKGKMVLVIMPKNTIWEQFYFLIKLQFSSIFRRKKEKVIANVDGENVATYYYNPKDIVNLAKQDFDLIKYKLIGFFVPPSYLEAFFKNKKWLLHFFNKMENRIKNWSFLSKYADHYIITLQKR
ncbi:class I SAM-dependent methyltransferase [Flavobacterium capsici]|uniref:Methyltransferase domain-containing protein n=1 Tax=Flavobacterium capsici TaxID=3075618 RepID=A0AA96J3J5_9FLAO|nr:MULTISPECIES: methyltransferase domain-containing protein [unclassified Flavobacterium]WNM19368.1 methyltransferase domain-containing protein [Flavobacterium sp. PMR2A8]WNM20757.1 methyltransferase domain-containing protein [Flavobacterium sp. PMTSA4]